MGEATGAGHQKKQPAGNYKESCGYQDHQGVAAWGCATSYVGVEELLQIIAKDHGDRRSSCCVTVLRGPINLRLQSCAARCNAVPTA